nr:HNH endonuclease signature motif containing protein [Spelaeicoccus albus]
MPNESHANAANAGAQLGADQFGADQLVAGLHSDELVALLGSTLTALQHSDLSPMTDRQLIDVLDAVDSARSRAASAYLRFVSQIDRRGAAPAGRTGVADTAKLLVTRHGISPGRAKADVGAAAAIYGRPTASALSGTTPSLPGPLSELGEQLAVGTIRLDHVDTAVRTLEKIPTHLLTDTDGDGARPFAVSVLAKFFARSAPTTRPQTLNLMARQLLRRLDPDTDDHYDPKAYERRGFTLGTDLTGMTVGTLQLDPAAAADLHACLDPLAAPRPDQRDEDGTIIARDERSPAQRNADALHEMARAAAGALGIAPAPELGGRAQPQTAESVARGLFDLRSGPDPAGCDPACGSRAGKLRPGRHQARVSVITTLEQISAINKRRNGSLAEGRPGYAPVDPTASHCDQLGPLAPGGTARITCDGVFNRVIVNAKGAIVDLGKSVRLASPSQRRALTARDRGCAFPGCDRPPTWCDVHHVVWYSRGGPTTLANMCLLCPAHHSLIHTGAWIAEMFDGIPYFRRDRNESSPFVYGTVVSAAGWIRNSYFDKLKQASDVAGAIVTHHDSSQVAGAG